MFKFKLHLLMILICLVTTACKRPNETKESNLNVLKILTWDGYADPEFVKEFEEKFKVKVEVTFVENDDQLWDKIKNKNEYDIFAANTAEMNRYIDNHLVTEIDLKDIPNQNNQKDRFKNYFAIKGITKDKEVYAVPYAYSEMGIIYNKELIKTPVKSVEVLWDKKYKGKILAYNTYQHNFTLAAMMMKLKNPFVLSDNEIEEVTKRLVLLRKNVLSFYNTIEDVNKIYFTNQLAYIFGNFGNQQVEELKKHGANIGYFIPNEGALAWLDCWAITKYSSKKDLAKKWINFSLEKKVSQALSIKHGLPNTITEDYGIQKEDKIIWLEPVNNPENRKRIWDNIITGRSN